MIASPTGKDVEVLKRQSVTRSNEHSMRPRTAEKETVLHQIHTNVLASQKVEFLRELGDRPQMNYFRTKTCLSYRHQFLGL